MLLHKQGEIQIQIQSFRLLFSGFFFDNIPLKDSREKFLLLHKHGEIQIQSFRLKDSRKKFVLLHKQGEMQIQIQKQIQSFNLKDSS